MISSHNLQMCKINMTGFEKQLNLILKVSLISEFQMHVSYIEFLSYKSTCKYCVLPKYYHYL